MNKNKIIFISIGGFALIAVLVLGGLMFSAYSEQSEVSDQLDGAVSTANRLAGSKVALEQSSIDAVKANETAAIEWFDRAFALASTGDIKFDSSLTAPAFKQKMCEDARQLSQLEGSIEGKIVKADFDFGFKDYILGGAMPAQEQLPVLCRRWTDVQTIVKVLAAAGVGEIRSIVIEQPKEAPVTETRNKKQKKEVKPLASSETYTFVFTARPDALVKAINALAAEQRFITVDKFAFSRQGDTLAQILGGNDKNAEQKSSRSGSRRKNRREEVKAEGSEEESNVRRGLVTDPALEAPFTVTATLSTFDFGTKDTKEKEVQE